jgi:hypothetical protein
VSERINRLDVVRDANRRLEAARSGAGGLEQVVRDLLARAFDARLAEALWWIEERRREAQAAQAWSSADGAPGCPPEPPKPTVRPPAESELRALFVPVRIGPMEAVIATEQLRLAVRSRAWVATVMDDVFSRCRGLRDAGQKEYAHAEDNAFGNFERLAADLRMAREKILWVYLRKHLDGILAWINGHRSQRESVHGRIQDAIVYLVLLDCMALERELTGSAATDQVQA